MDERSYFSKEDIWNAKTHAERSLIIGEMKIKLQRGINFTSIRMATIKKIYIQSMLERMWRKEPSYTVGRNVDWYIWRKV